MKFDLKLQIERRAVEYRIRLTQTPMARPLTPGIIEGNAYADPSDGAVGRMRIHVRPRNLLPAPKFGGIWNVRIVGDPAETATDVGTAGHRRRICHDYNRIQALVAVMNGGGS